MADIGFVQTPGNSAHAGSIHTCTERSIRLIFRGWSRRSRCRLHRVAEGRSGQGQPAGVLSTNASSHGAWPVAWTLRMVLEMNAEVFRSSTACEVGARSRRRQGV